MEAAVDQQLIVTTAQAAELLGVSKSTVTRFLRDGILKGYKLHPASTNSPFRIYRTSVDRLIQQRQTPEKEAAAQAGTAA